MAAGNHRVAGDVGEGLINQGGAGTWLNGRRVQDDNTGNMIHQIPELIEYISSFSLLEPGDVIITGSPGGRRQEADTTAASERR